MTGAEGATASETLRPQDQRHDKITLESGANAPAEGIAISGEKDRGGTGAQSICCANEGAD